MRKDNRVSEGNKAISFTLNLILFSSVRCSIVIFKELIKEHIYNTVYYI